MGIPSYFSFIIKNYQNTIIKHTELFNNTSTYYGETPSQSKSFNLFIDANSIIYDSIKDIDFSNDTFEILIFQSVCNKIDSLIKLFKINNELIIAFDGVAPLAKLEQQRTRRYKNSFIKQLKNETSSWNTSNITPGTLFMKKLMQHIKQHYDNNIFNIKKINIFSSDEPGEGEHKIFQYIRNNRELFLKEFDTNTIIYGLDADLIMLSLIHIPYFQNLYLYRETPEFIKSINSSFDINSHYLINIRTLKGQILNLYNKYYNKTQLYNKFHIKILDYILICFLLGNDFLPHFPSLNIRTNGIDNILYAYCNTIKQNQTIITKNFTIDWKLFRKFCNYLYENELNNIKTEIKIRKKMNNNYNKNIRKYKTIENLPILNQNIEDGIDVHNKGWQIRYYKFLFDIDYNEENIKYICLNYIEGIEWTFTYYTNKCINWQWKYKYHYPPLFEDLIKYIPYFETSLLTENYEKISPLTQLCYVLPHSSLDIIPNNTKELLLEKLKDKYPESYEFNWAFCKYFWESHILLPELDINEINDVLNY